MSGALLPSDASVATDPEIAAIAKPYHERALAYLNEPLAIASGPFPGERARLEDTALLDLVNDTQLAATGAELSMTSLLPFRFEGWEAGPVTVRQVYALYPYENQLVVLEIDGARAEGRPRARGELLRHGRVAGRAPRRDAPGRDDALQLRRPAGGELPHRPDGARRQPGRRSCVSAGGT